MVRSRLFPRRGGEIGIRSRLKIYRWQHHVGSSPTPGTNLSLKALYRFETANVAGNREGNPRESKGIQESFAAVFGVVDELEKAQIQG